MCNTPTVLMAFCSRTCKKLLCYIALLLPLLPFMASRSLAIPLDQTTSTAELAPPSATPRDKIDRLLDVVVVEERNVAIYISRSGPAILEPYKQLHISARQFSSNLPLESFGRNGEVTPGPFSDIFRAKGIVDGDNLYIAVLGTLESPPKKQKLHIFKLNLLTGKMDDSFAEGISQNLPEAEHSHFPDRLYIHNDRLLVPINHSRVGHIYAYNLETGKLDTGFANGGQLSIGSDTTRVELQKTILNKNELYIGAAFRNNGSQADKFSYQMAICRVDLASGQIEAPFDCTSEASWLNSKYGYHNKIRAMTLASNGSIVLGVDESTTKVPYVENTVVLYSFDRTTGALNHSFGSSGRLELTSPGERYMLDSIISSGDHLLVNIERLSPNLSGKPYSPFSARKELIVYALHTHTGELNHSFGDNGRLSLTGQPLKIFTTGYSILQPEQNRLLVVMDAYGNNRARLLRVFAVDTKTGTLKHNFGNSFGESVIKAETGESLYAHQAHIAANGQIILFNELYWDNNSRGSPNSTVLTADGLISQYPLKEQPLHLPHHGSRASTLLPGYNVLTFTWLAMMGAYLQQHP